MFQKTYLQFDKWEVMGIQTCRRSHISQIYLFQFWTKDIVRNAVAAVLRAYGNIFFFLKYILRRKQHNFIKLTPSDHQKVLKSMLTNGDKKCVDLRTCSSKFIWIHHLTFCKSVGKLCSEPKQI